MGKPVHAVRLVGTMRGRSGALLVDSLEGVRYVIKTAGDSRMPNLLANEYLGTAVAEAVGLPVPRARLIHLSAAFLQHPYFAVALKERAFTPSEGLHYASESVSLPVPHFLMEYLPRCRAALVHNHAAFLGMYILDVWAKHMDERQAVFAQERNLARIRAVFIDHGDMFGGPLWDFRSRERGPYHPAMSMYSKTWTAKAVNSWVKLFRAKLPKALESAVACLPPWWFAGDTASLQAHLHTRLRNLPDLIDDAFSGHALLKEKMNDKLHVQNPRVREIGVGG